MALAQAGGIDAGGDPAADLLAQIRALLEQYLALGDQTPVAPEAQALAQAIDTSAGGEGGELGAGPTGPYSPEAPPAGPGEEAPDMLGLDTMLPEEGEPPRDTSKKSFESARGSAEDRLKKRNKKK